MKPLSKYIAIENIKEGNPVTLLWKRYCRNSRDKDFIIAGIAFKNCKKGEKVSIIQSIDNLYEANVI